jgi:hypothetical protein
MRAIALTSTGSRLAVATWRSQCGKARDGRPELLPHHARIEQEFLCDLVIRAALAREPKYMPLATGERGVALRIRHLTARRVSPFACIGAKVGSDGLLPFGLLVGYRLDVQ